MPIYRLHENLFVRRDTIKSNSILENSGVAFIGEDVFLIEDKADAFLESIGITLYEDSIAIDGTLYDGTYGESILESNGIFLYEDGIVLEGMSKKEYLDKKEQEANDKDNAAKAAIERNKRRQKNISHPYYGEYHVKLNPKDTDDSFKRDQRFKYADTITDRYLSKHPEHKNNRSMIHDSICRNKLRKHDEEYRKIDAEREKHLKKLRDKYKTDIAHRRGRFSVHSDSVNKDETGVRSTVSVTSSGRVNKNKQYWDN